MTLPFYIIDEVPDDSEARKGKSLPLRKKENHQTQHRSNFDPNAVYWLLLKKNVCYKIAIVFSSTANIFYLMQGQREKNTYEKIFYFLLTYLFINRLFWHVCATGQDRLCRYLER